MQSEGNKSTYRANAGEYLVGVTLLFICIR